MNAPGSELPKIEPGAPKKPRPWFQIRLWMLLLAMTFLSVLFAAIGPQRPRDPGVPESRIRVQNWDEASLFRMYEVRFRDGAREIYYTKWFLADERLTTLEVIEPPGNQGFKSRSYYADAPTPERAINDTMRRNFETIQASARARAISPRTLNPPLYDVESGRVRFERRVPTETWAYLDEDAPHAEHPSGP